MSNLTEDQQIEVILNSNLHHSKSSAHIAKELQSLTAIIVKQGNIDGKTRDEVSKRTGIATGNISKYKQILESERAEELFNRIDLPSDDPDNLSLNGAYQEVKQPKIPDPKPSFDIPKKVVETPVNTSWNNSVVNKTPVIAPMVKQPVEPDGSEDEPDFHLELCPHCQRPFKI